MTSPSSSAFVGSASKRESRLTSKLPLQWQLVVTVRVNINISANTKTVVRVQNGCQGEPSNK